jgi:hypothetical protein
MNASLLGWVTRASSPSPRLTPLVEGGEAAYVMWAVTAVIGLGLTTWSVYRRRMDADRSLALLAVASLLFSPLGWVYYAWFLVPPLLALICTGRLAAQRAFLVPSVVASLWPLWLSGTGRLNALATLTVGSVYFWGLLSLWLALMRSSLPADPEPARAAAPGAVPPPTVRTRSRARRAG